MRSLALCFAATALGVAPRATGDAQQTQRVTILYDAFGQPSSLEQDWGFAALIEYGGRRVLFDAGNDAGIFERNVKRLGTDLSRLDAVVISHRHGDHTSGLSHLLQRKGRHHLGAARRRILQERASARFPRPTPGSSAQSALLRRPTAHALGQRNTLA